MPIELIFERGQLPNNLDVSRIFKMLTASLVLFHPLFMLTRHVSIIEAFNVWKDVALKTFRHELIYFTFCIVKSSQSVQKGQRIGGRVRHERPHGSERIGTYVKNVESQDRSLFLLSSSRSCARRLRVLIVKSYLVVDCARFWSNNNNLYVDIGRIACFPCALILGTSLPITFYLILNYHSSGQKYFIKIKRPTAKQLGPSEA